MGLVVEIIDDTNLVIFLAISNAHHDFNSVEFLRYYFDPPGQGQMGGHKFSISILMFVSTYVHPERKYTSYKSKLGSWRFIRFTRCIFSPLS